jgi:hypothetical protein
MSSDPLVMKLIEENKALELKLHQLSEDHSHCEDLLNELGARASSAESRLCECALTAGRAMTG